MKSNFYKSFHYGHDDIMKQIITTPNRSKDEDGISGLIPSSPSIRKESAEIIEKADRTPKEKL